MQFSWFNEIRNSLSWEFTASKSSAPLTLTMNHATNVECWRRSLHCNTKHWNLRKLSHFRKVNVERSKRDRDREFQFFVNLWERQTRVESLVKLIEFFLRNSRHLKINNSQFCGKKVNFMPKKLKTRVWNWEIIDNATICGLIWINFLLNWIVSWFTSKERFKYFLI